MTQIKTNAPAKVNLTLHVTGQRDDGYHLLDSLVVFMGRGDGMTADVADALTLSVTGPFAQGVPTDDTNLMMQAAAALRNAHGLTTGARMTLDKNLPHAAGIGSGSSDAAATLKMLATLWGVDPLPSAQVLGLGADVPVCLQAPAPTRMRGIGEVLEKVPTLPDCALVLVRPPVAVPTGPVFAGLATKHGSQMDTVPKNMDFTTFAGWLGTQRNDLQPPACVIAPQIQTVLDALDRFPEVALARMSGSGATCFGLVANMHDANQVATEMRRKLPDCWISAGALLGPSASKAN